MCFSFPWEASFKSGLKNKHSKCLCYICFQNAQVVRIFDSRLTGFLHYVSLGQMIKLACPMLVVFRCFSHWNLCMQSNAGTFCWYFQRCAGDFFPFSLSIKCPTESSGNVAHLPWFTNCTLFTNFILIFFIANVLQHTSQLILTNRNWYMLP